MLQQRDKQHVNLSVSLSVEEALGVAAAREELRLAQIHADLCNLRAQGFEADIGAPDLLKLERNGFLYDFDSGAVIERPS